MDSAHPHASPGAPVATVTAAEVLDATPARLPLPGHGRTRARWRTLTEVARRDLALVKLVESHHDARAILADLEPEQEAPAGVGAVWAAEPPHARLRYRRGGTGQLTVDGSKAFCSGAAVVDWALVTADGDDGPRLLRIDVAGARTEGLVRLHSPTWVAAGMARSDTRTIDVDALPAAPVGPPGGYVDRPGFWHGAMGVAACWAGGTRGVAAPLLESVRRHDRGPLPLAALGRVTCLLDGVDHALDRAAELVDADPDDTAGTARRWAESLRATVARAADEVATIVAGTLGPAPLAFDAAHTRRVADLALFVRQHHGDRDLADLGALLRDGHEQW